MPVYKTSKDKILEKAAAVFRVKGYFHTSISDLATACELEKPHFYYYFKNGKKEIMEEVLKYVDSLMEKYIWKLAYDDSYTPKDRLIKMTERLRKYYLNDKGGCIFGNTILETANTKDDFKAIITATFNKWEQALKHLFQTSYSPEKAEELAFTFIQDLQGGLMLFQLYGDVKFLELAEERSIALLTTE